MPGFVTRDAQGRVTFQLSDRLVRLLGSVQIHAGNTAGSVVIPDGMKGAPFFYCSYSQPINGNYYADQNIQLSGRTVSWYKMPEGSIIVFGVY